MVETLKLVGPFEEFRLKKDEKTGTAKGFGFCAYKDIDIAASALRNLDKIDLQKRGLRVSFASDDKHGINLKVEEVRHRDRQEIVDAKGN